jgi:hypothetical protein
VAGAAGLVVDAPVMTCRSSMSTLSKFVGKPVVRPTTRASILAGGDVQELTEGLAVDSLDAAVGSDQNVARAV